MRNAGEPTPQSQLTTRQKASQRTGNMVVRYCETKPDLVGTGLDFDPAASRTERKHAAE
jgi:hypothetical protein